jgi:hypothetical protein
MKGQEIRILDRAALQILGEFHPTYLVRTPIRQVQARNRPGE